jgi:hypothetical protein
MPKIHFMITQLSPTRGCEEPFEPGIDEEVTGPESNEGPGPLGLSDVVGVVIGTEVGMGTTMVEMTRGGVEGVMAGGVEGTMAGGVEGGVEELLEELLEELIAAVQHLVQILTT